MFHAKNLVLVSGGQDGADLGFLEAGKYLGLQTAGYMPKDFRTESGNKPQYQEEYGLQETFGGNRQRDILNVQQSDLVIAFLLNKEQTGRGTMSTINCARNGQHKHIELKKEEAEVMVFDGENDQKPVIVFWDITRPKLPIFQVALYEFLMKHQPQRIMVSGPCHSTYPEIDELVRELIIDTLTNFIKPEEMLKGVNNDYDKVISDSKNIPKHRPRDSEGRQWCSNCEEYHD